MKILIAEDDIINRKLLSKLLSKYGECDLAINGIQALDAYINSVKENKPYDLIFLDIMMPKVDGVKVLKVIKDFEAKKVLSPNDRVKVVIVTALDDTEYVCKSFELGCDAYISKPIVNEKLSEVMQKFKVAN